MKSISSHQPRPHEAVDSTAGPHDVHEFKAHAEVDFDGMHISLDAGLRPMADICGVAPNAVDAAPMLTPPSMSTSFIVTSASQSNFLPDNPGEGVVMDNIQPLSAPTEADGIVASTTIGSSSKHDKLDHSVITESPITIPHRDRSGLQYQGLLQDQALPTGTTESHVYANHGSASNRKNFDDSSKPLSDPTTSPFWHLCDEAVGNALSSEIVTTEPTTDTFVGRRNHDSSLRSDLPVMVGSNKLSSDALEDVETAQSMLLGAEVLGSKVLYAEVFETVDNASPLWGSKTPLIGEGPYAYRRYFNPVRTQSRQSEKYIHVDHQVVKLVLSDNGCPEQDKMDSTRMPQSCVSPEKVEIQAREKRRSNRSRRVRTNLAKREHASKILHEVTLVVQLSSSTGNRKDDSYWPRYDVREVMTDLSKSPVKKRRLESSAQATSHVSSASHGILSPQKATWFSYQRSVSRVGKAYQVPSLPPAIAIQEHDSVEPMSQGYGVLWDGRLAEAALQNGEQLENFFHILPRDRMMLMTILHNCNYKVNDARNVLIETLKSVPSVPFSNFDIEETDCFSEFMMKDFGVSQDLNGEEKPVLSKRFSKIAKFLDKTVDECIRHYYTKFKKGPMYNRFKSKLHQQRNLFKDANDDSLYDFCVLCDDGGELISCDECFRDFHRMCLRPPLLFVPEGDWFCPHCKKDGEIS